jgi:catechol 2,3-dioxygenase-like lactoylglutathione lyase family enzyme
VLVRHLALNVSDPRRSADFYLSTVGLDGEAHVEPWGVRVKFPDGFMLALIQGDPLPKDLADRVHFGCALETSALMRETRSRLLAAGVHEIEWEDAEVEEGYVGVKIADPDGYVIEIYYDVH